ncbi:serine acetyltransferase [bacterium]|nr:serine acetyltransferase [bacterium]
MVDGRFDEELKARQQLPEVVERILASFSEPYSLAHLDSKSMPDEPSIVKILETLEAILFPGYFRRYEIERHNLIFYLGELTIEAYNGLAEQLARAYWTDCKNNHNADKASLCGDCDRQARAVALQFLKQIPDLRKILATDVKAAYDGDPAAKSFEEIIFCYPGVKALTVYRIANALYKMEVPLIPRIMTEYAHRQTGIDIHPGATIGEGFFIDHGTGVVIGETTHIGKHVQIYQGVTLGALRFRTDEHGRLIRDTKRHPTIEDNVTIYAQATILGGDTVIGEGSVIGGNVWLTHSLPPRSKVQIDPEIKLSTKKVEDAADDLRVEP